MCCVEECSVQGAQVPKDGLQVYQATCGKGEIRIRFRRRSLSGRASGVRIYAHKSTSDVHRTGKLNPVAESPECCVARACVAVHAAEVALNKLCSRYGWPWRG